MHRPNSLPHTVFLHKLACEAPRQAKRQLLPFTQTCPHLSCTYELIMSWQAMLLLLLLSKQVSFQLYVISYRPPESWRRLRSSRRKPERKQPRKQLLTRKPPRNLVTTNLPGQTRTLSRAPRQGQATPQRLTPARALKTLSSWRQGVKMKRTAPPGILQAMSWRWTLTPAS